MIFGIGGLEIHMQLVRGYYQYHDIEEYRREAINAAKDLEYSDSVIAKIEAAKTEAQIANIMANARKGA